MTEWEGKNLLCYGDNLGFLTDRQLFPDACVDLIYLDPPFNSQQSYNVLFKEASGTPEAAQIKAFEDTWTWDTAANIALTQIHTDPAVPAPLVDLMKTFMNFLRPSPMMAYLVQMAIRLVHMHRILKPTGSLYLHCDPTASHYLKLVLDAIFGPTNFLDEVVWKRTPFSGSSKARAQQYPRSHDVLLFYSKGTSWTWTCPTVPYSQEYLARFKWDDNDGRGPYRKTLLKTYSQQTFERLKSENRLVPPVRAGAKWSYKQYLSESSGTRQVDDIWTDINAINPVANERLGYPTQKPVELLKRIVAASSNPGDVVMDPFCGCGTTIDAVETLNRENPKQAPRRWIGIDITHLSINLIKHRLTRFSPVPEYLEIGQPESVGAAEKLAQDDPYQFQFWALGLIGARPAGGSRKKGADRGIDGVRYFQDEQKNGAMVTKKMLVQVKGGHAIPGHVRDLVGTVNREKAEMGVFITLEEPSKQMRSEAAAAGTYTSPWDHQAYPKIQILTIEELLKDPHRPNPRCLQIPAGYTQHTLPDPPKHRSPRTRQGKLGFDEQAGPGGRAREV